MRLSFRTAILPTLILACAGSVPAQDNETWHEPFSPHRVVGNVYYVGTRGLASFLITTPDGHVLINSGLKSSVPMIRASVENWDHNAGSALVKQLTGAKYLVMEQDVAVTEDGGKSDFEYGAMPSSLYEPAKVDRALHDGDEVKLGGSTLKAHLTPGHTKGCTTWTMTVQEGGRSYDIVIVGSPNVNAGYKLVNNGRYPGIAEDFARTFQTLKSLHCDIFLGAHGDYYGMEGKVARMTAAAPDVFVDPDGYRAYVSERQQAFLAALERQKK